MDYANGDSNCPRAMIAGRLANAGEGRPSETRSIDLVSQPQAAKLLNVSRRIGAMLREMPMHGGDRKSSFHDESLIPTLSDLGINYTASHRWQVMAGPDDETFGAWVAEMVNADAEITEAAWYRYAWRREQPDRPEPVELPAGVFSCIEADPPWALDASEAKSAIGQYTVMDLEAIKAMGPDVQARAADNAHLWLWAINPMLPEALDVMAAWGFDYKGCLTWVKTNGFGTGHYLRGATEHCLLGVRGTLACLRNDQRTYFEAPRTDHSRKPEGFYDILETLSPGPRMRLFARSQRDGWESWGDEA